MTHQHKSNCAASTSATSISKASRGAVLVIDDDPDMVDALSHALTRAGFSVRTAGSVTDAEAALRAGGDILAVLTDNHMPGATGLSLAKRLLAARMDEDAVELVLMTGHATVDDAAAAMRAGTFDFLQKPFSIRQVVDCVGAAVAQAALRRSQAAHLRTTTNRLRAAEEHVEALRHTDLLTGLSNRQAMLDRLEAPAGAAARTTAVIVAEIRRFGGINEVAEADGSSRADVLRAVAARLREAPVAATLIARHEGAVFSIALVGADPAAAAIAAVRLHAALSAPLRIGRHDFCLSVQVGVAHRDAVGDGDLLLAAEAASHAAEPRSGRPVAAFDRELHREIIRRLTLEHALPGAAERGELSLLFQPIVGVADRSLVGFEALLRWQHPRFGAVSPVEFIPIAEEAGSIGGIGRWVIRESLGRAVAWRRLVGERAPRISVNVSPAQFAEGDVVEEIVAALAGSALPATAFGVELTESGLVQDGIITSLARLRAYDIKVSIDDFGTGYSSLSWLRDLPSDVVKLDRSFVSSIERSPPDEAFFEAIVRLAMLSGRSTLAEGIETEGQLAILRRCGCDFAQGYHFSRPLDQDAADRLVARAVAIDAELPLRPAAR